VLGPFAVLRFAEAFFGAAIRPALTVVCLDVFAIVFSL
jgi:hypothetical protein